MLEQAIERTGTDVLARHGGFFGEPVGDPSSGAAAARGEGAFPLKVAVVIITCRRAEVLGESIVVLGSQTRRPDVVIVSAAEFEDVPPLPEDSEVQVVYGPRGACRQRNTALNNLPADVDLVIFFDDDFVAHPRWIEAAERCFSDRPEVDCLTGFLLADGVKSGGLTFAEAADLVDGYRDQFEGLTEEGYSPYGCNMAFRRAAMRGLSFDERLVLYGWLEDRDFAASVSRRGGRQIKTGTAVGVHLGVNRGRVSGIRLGYSQIVNPIYIFRKRNMSFWQLADHILRNFGMNSLRCAYPESHIDRAGRLIGNFRGLLDVIRGIVNPERAELVIGAK